MLVHWRYHRRIVDGSFGKNAATVAKARSRTSSEECGRFITTVCHKGMPSENRSRLKRYFCQQLLRTSLTIHLHGNNMKSKDGWDLPPSLLFMLLPLALRYIPLGDIDILVVSKATCHILLSGGCRL